MPLYCFQCEKCGQEFEFFLRPGEVQNAKVCPHCGSSQVKEQQAASTAPESCSLGKKT